MSMRADKARLLTICVVCGMQALFAGRTDNAVKNRWNSTIQKTLREYQIRGLDGGQVSSTVLGRHSCSCMCTYQCLTLVLCQLAVVTKNRKQAQTKDLP